MPVGARPLRRGSHQPLPGARNLRKFWTDAASTNARQLRQFRAPDPAASPPDGEEHPKTVRDAILALPETAWRPAIDADGDARDNGHVAELTGQLDLSSWPAGSRVIVRRERPHPGAQLSFTDADGYRFQAILTDQPGDIVVLERGHRERARVEDRIRAAKDSGLENLPFRDFDANGVWLELVLVAQDLVFCAQTLCLDGELARCEPKRLRYRLLHCAGRLSFHARQARLRLPRSWPWAGELAAAFARLAALPAG
jgi:DDE family transposase